MYGVFIKRKPGSKWPGLYHQHRIGGEEGGKWYPLLAMKDNIQVNGLRCIWRPEHSYEELEGLWVTAKDASDGDDRRRVEQFMADKGGVPEGVI